VQRLSLLPFRQWILPDRIPTYGDALTADARHPGFAFSLKPILKDAGIDLSLSSRVSVDDTVAIDELEARTELDLGQCQTLITALTREFAFIQGPPGTGKSYLECPTREQDLSTN
jgi:hypothetical protein